jgi:DNA-binding CsgD family transcriptional regulator
MVAEHDRSLTLQAIEHLTIGVIVLAGDSSVLFVNKIAERLLRAGQGITVRRGRLQPQDARHAARLERLVYEAAETGAGRRLKAGGGILSVPRSTGGQLALLVAPLRASHLRASSMQPAAIVILSDPDTAAPARQQLLSRTYRLTRAEARLLSALLSGRTLSEYAATAGISINTARAHLRQVLQKTGHSRQVDLIRANLFDPVMNWDFRL